jgi:hypothetical protein
MSPFHARLPETLYELEYFGQLSSDLPDQSPTLATDEFIGIIKPFVPLSKSSKRTTVGPLAPNPEPLMEMECPSVTVPVTVEIDGAA